MNSHLKLHTLDLVFSSSILFLDQIKLISNNKSNFIGVIEEIHSNYGLNIVILNDFSFLDYLIIKNSLYKTLFNKHCKNIKIHRFFPFNLLMQLFCTTQINLLQKYIIPVNISKQELENVVLIAVNSKSIIGNDLHEITSILNDNFEMVIKTSEKPNKEHNESEILEKLFDVKNSSEKIHLRYKIMAKMALFSLDLQLKQ